MNVAYASHDTASQNVNTTLVINKPSGLAVGDMLFVVLNVGSSNPWNTPSGWTAVGGTVQSSDYPTRMNMFAKIADASDVAASTFTFTASSGAPKSGVLYRLTGDFSGSSTPTDYITVDGDNSVSPSAGTVTFPGGVTPLSTNPLLIFAVAEGGTGGDSSPSFSAYAVANNNPSWTEDADLGIQVGDWMHTGSAHASYASAGATGAYSLTTIRTSRVHGGTLVSINEVMNATANPGVQVATGSIPTPSATGGASISPAVVTALGSVQSPVVTAAAAPWTNEDKSVESDWTNQDKSS